MSMLLCHECYGWVEPRDGYCPDCLAAADMNEADPPPSRLRMILGDVAVRLGQVTVRRQHLPDGGVLYATTKGLCFLPLEDVVADAGAPVAGPAVARATSLVRVGACELNNHRPTETLSTLPAMLTPADSDCLPDLLMGHPAAFFVPAVSIRSIRRRLSRWVVRRRRGAKLSFKPVPPRGPFHAGMSQLISAPPWNSILP